MEFDVSYPPTAAAQVAFMIGDPVAHTALPRGVNEWAAGAGKNVLMTPALVAPEALDGFLGALRVMRNCGGAVVTAPHKQAAASRADELTDAARLVGAANLMVRQPGGALVGDNIDGQGFVAALAAVGTVSAIGRAILFGCGGAGASIGAALIEAGILALDLVDLDAERAGSLARRLGSRSCPVARPGSVEAYGLIINATTVGLDGTSMVHPLSGLSPRSVVADVITEPAMTPFLLRASQLGARVQTGPQMALAQLPLLARAFGWE